MSYPIRVSMAALICISSGKKYLLVRNLHRPDLYSPLGGVYKYFPGAIPLLADLGFCPVGYSASSDNPLSLSDDLKRDLRGYVAPENFERFLDWFRSRKQREVVECPLRELREELEEAHVPPNIVVRAQRYELTLIRSVTEGPNETPWGYQQFRWIDVYEPSSEDHTLEASNRQITCSLFAAVSDNPSLLQVRRHEVEHVCTDDGKHLTGTTIYLLGGERRSPMEMEAPFGTAIAASQGYENFNDFVRRRIPTTLKNAKVISEPTFLHGVDKHQSESIVAQISCDNVSYVIKYYPDSDIYVRKELWARGALKAGSPSVAHIVEAKEGRPAFLVFEHVAGRRLSECSESQVRSAIEGVVRSVAHFRQITFDKYGEIIGEFNPVGNHSELGDYARSVVTYCRSQLGAYTSHLSAKLLAWADHLLAGGQSDAVKSALSSRPCLCHSDVKLTDIIVRESTQGVDVVVLDFDNVFSFVPEFDLCKFHFSMYEHGVHVDLHSYAEIIGSLYNVSPAHALEGLRSVYPLMLLRLLAWGVRRGHERLLEQIGAVSALLSFQEDSWSERSIF